ncbi:M23 family metallopeptidase, partial [Streptomyces sp. SID13726]|uniref:M23 family metallopeptidase n=1 Tax=Streptomyces sp. SID13726 TaxID=2706058 RepID=UPI001EF32CE2
LDPPLHDWLPGHRGVDLAAAAGETVLAPAPGVVTFAGPVAGRDVVVVTHDGGLRTSLEPVTAVAPRGTRVAAGDVVGTVQGSPGDETVASHCAAACVHWGVRRGERYVDPLALLGERPPIVLLPLGEPGPGDDAPGVLRRAGRLARTSCAAARPSRGCSAASSR